METLKGFPNPPALWLRRSKTGYAYAITAPQLLLVDELPVLDAVGLRGFGA